MFENEQSHEIMQKKLLPALEELARAEFGAYSMTGNIDEETVEWMVESKRRIQTLVERYLGGLLETHVGYGNALKELGGDLDHGGRFGSVFVLDVFIRNGATVEKTTLVLTNGQYARFEDFFNDFRDSI